MKPADVLRDVIRSFASLGDGWDGERAAAPTKAAIEAALSFLRVREDLGAECGTTLHVNGGVLLEADDERWTIQFSPNGGMIMSGAVPPAEAGIQTPSPKDHPHA